MKGTHAIQTVQEAFDILDSKNEFRFAAIHFLYNYPHSQEIEDKIVYAITHVYDNPEGYLIDYVLVAENHLTPRLIEPVMNIFTHPSESAWDQLEDEANYLLQKLAVVYPDEMIKLGLPILTQVIDQDIDANFFFTFDMFRFLPQEKCIAWYIETMQKRFTPNDHYIKEIMQLNISETIPYIRQALDEYTKNYWDPDEVSIEKLEEYFRLLQNGTIKQFYPSSFEKRNRWEESYLGVEDQTLQEEEIKELCKLPHPWYFMHAQHSNEECYCGKLNKSGYVYKYRNCYLAKEAKLVNLPRLTQSKTGFLPN